MKPISVLVPPGSLVAGAEIDLDETELHHLRVRRVSLDREVTAMDGAGVAAAGSFKNRGSTAIFVVESITTEPPQPVTVLAVGAGDRERLMQLVERATELGISDVVPVEMERAKAVESRWRERDGERAIRRAREACKQSGNPWAALVHDICNLDDLAARFPVGRWFLADALGSPLPPLGASESVGWIIGPEGGLTSAELEYCGTVLMAEPVRLAGPILRFDTAAVAAAALTLDRRGSEG